MGKGHIGRRAILGGGVGLALASPFFRVARAVAGPSTPPKRLVIWHVPSGTVEYEYRPTAGATQSDFTLGRILEPLEHHRSSLLLFGPEQTLDARGRDITVEGYGWREERGLSIKVPGANGHTLSKMLTGVEQVSIDGVGWAGGPSLDQVVAERIGGATPFRSLELAVHDGYAGSGPVARMIYSAAGTALPPEKDPRAAFDRLFAGLGEPDPAIERAQRRRRALLDFGRAELEAARSSVGASERRLIDAHATSLEELDRRLTALASAVCMPPERAADSVVSRPAYNQAPRELYEAQVDVLAHAIGCDLTRVGSISFGRSDSHTIMPWIGGLAGSEWHHALTHTNPHLIAPANEGTDGYAKLQALVEVHRFYTGLLARFMDQLAAMPEGDGTVLDNTLILAFSEISEGQFHTAQNMPMFLAGGAAGALRMGRYVQVGDESHTRLLLSVAHAMGLDDLTSFGDPDYCPGPLSDLT